MNRFGFFDPFLSNTGSKIISIEKTGEQGDKDEYTVTYEDGTTLTFYVDNCNEVEVTTNGVQPTDERVELWVDLNSTTTIRIPEINDLVINQSDTWSSEKIDNELDTKMPIDTNYAADISMNLDSSNFVLSVQLKDQNGNNIGHLRTANLPMDSMVVEGSYDNTTKNITLTLNNGNTVVFPIGDLINGLQTEITENNPLDVDLIDGLYNYSKIIVKNENSTTEVKPVTNSDILTLEAGNNIIITASNGNAGLDNIKIATNAEVNQNTFSTVNANGTSIVADSKTDTLTMTPGTNIQITGCANNDTLTIATNAEVNQNTFSTVNANGTSIVADSKTDALTIVGANDTKVTANNKTITVDTKIPNGYSIIRVNNNAATLMAYNQTSQLDINSSGLISIEQCSTGNTRKITFSTSAETNQNAFSSVNANGNTINASGKTDTLKIEAGNQIHITKNSTSNAVVIAANVGNAFGKVNANGTELVADTIVDTLNIAPGNEITITSCANTDTLTIASKDQKVKQDILVKPTTEGNIERHPLLLTKSNPLNTNDIIDETYRKNTLYYDNTLNALQIEAAVNTVNQYQSAKITLLANDNSATTISPQSHGEATQVYLPSSSGVLVTQGDVTDQLTGAGIEIDFANKTYKKLGRTDYNNIACFGNRKLCYVSRGYETSHVTIITDFTTVPNGGNIMVQQPKVYYKVVPITTRTLSNGTIVVDKCQYWVSDKPTGGMQIHPAFVRGNDVERNFIYHGAYPINYALPGPDTDPKNSVQDTTGTNNRAIYTSSALAGLYGYQPRAYQTRAWYRNGAVGQDNYYNRNMSIETIYSASLEQLLMLIEYGPNFQNNFSIGWTNLTDDTSYNCSPLSGACFTNGNKSMAKGNNSLLNNTNVLVHGTRNASGTYSYSYRGVENFFGGLYEWIDGINLRGTGSGEKVYIIRQDSLNYADDTISEYLDTGIILPNTNGWIKSFVYSPNYDWILMPGEVGGSGDSNLPIGDYFYQTTNLDSSSWRCALLGGHWDDGLNAGFCYWLVHGGSGDWNRRIGARLMMLGDNENS